MSTTTQLSEALTRLDVAYDQALTAAIVGYDEFTEDERDALIAIIDNLKAVLNAHGAHGEEA